MKKFVFVSVIILFGVNLDAQKSDIAYDSEEFLENPANMDERMPRFPGCENLIDNKEKKMCGDEKMKAFIYNELKYPKKAFKKNIEGVVVVSFTVGTDGILEDIELVRDIGSGCGKEALRVMKKMRVHKKWIPAIQNGKYVKVRFNLPITFSVKYLD